MPESDDKPRMNGQTVIRHAGRNIVEACNTLLARNSLKIENVRWLVPHQANANLLHQIARSPNFPADGDRVVSVLVEYGNSSSASMGIALDTLRALNEPSALPTLPLSAQVLPGVRSWQPS